MRGKRGEEGRGGEEDTGVVTDSPHQTMSYLRKAQLFIGRIDNDRSRWNDKEKAAKQRWNCFIGRARRGT